MSTTCELSVSPEQEPASQTYTVFHDPNSSWEVSTTIVLGLESLTGYESTQLIPLYEAVDPKTLESHLAGRERGVTLSFDYHGFDVTVQDNGRVEFTPLEEA